MDRKDIDKAPEIKPVFVVGLPRSGTTLLYQLLLNHFDWSYFTMWSDYYYRAPVAAYSIQRLIFPKPQSFEYESEYGKLKDYSYLSRTWRPVEGHRIWQRWFPKEPTHCYEGGLSVAQRKQMLATIAGFVKISGKPFLNKNPRNSLRVTGLLEVFPRAAFIVVRRSSLYVAQSLYIARLKAQSKNNHGHNMWWGTRPKEFSDLQKLDPMSQAVGQTKAIERELKKQLLASKSRHVEIDYRDICERPNEILLKVQELCEQRSIKVKRIGDLAVTPFPVGDNRKVSEADFESIKRLLHQF